MGCQGLFGDRLGGRVVWFTLSAGGLCREVMVFWRLMFFCLLEDFGSFGGGSIGWAALVFRVAV